MRFAPKRTPAQLLAGVVIAGLATAFAVGDVMDRRQVVGRELEEVARMTQNMKTVCVGRFLIDLPREAQVELTGAGIDGLAIAAFEESRAAFEERLQERRTELERTPDWRGGNQNLEQVRAISTAAGMEGRMHVHGRTVSETTVARGLDVAPYRYESLSVEAMIHGQGISIDLSASRYDPESIEALPRLIDKAVPNPGDAIPSGPGFCMRHAFFRDPIPAEQYERIVLHARFPAHPDIKLRLLLMAGTTPAAKGLLERTDNMFSEFASLFGSVVTQLRAARRTINGLPGEEVAERMRDAGDAYRYHFWWETSGSQTDVMLPYLSFTMETGRGERGPVPSSLSEHASAALWDRIVASIRPRPLAPVRATPPGPPPVALGTRALAGERCPQAGWWQCSDGASGMGVYGGRRQYLAQGERMPQALLLPPQALWQRLRGLQPSVESGTPTGWKLVDKRWRGRSAAVLPLAAALAGTAGTAGAAVAAGEGTAAIGTLTATGAPCPASGWWRCEDDSALDGARWFARGSLLPPATFAAPAHRFGWAPGRMAPSGRRSAWRLMRLAASPDSVPDTHADPHADGADAHADAHAGRAPHAGA